MGSIMNPVLLDKIDRLFACGVGEYIELPQLVVVGDQSSGKSSVLEGITNLPFPRDSGLCTRFATQITFRRAPITNTTVSIIPSKDASQSHREKIRAWKSHISQDLDPETFSKIMEEVHELMGLRDDTPGSRRTFSKDILKLEVCGPDCQHFSVVDVPGIFRTATKGLTTLEDAQMVKAMVQGYMANKRSVMLAVIPANIDIATQEILTMAEEADPEGHRTLGVLTKPDLVDPGAESGVVQLIRGERHPLNLGWCLVRNLGQQQAQDTSNSRTALEKAFFRDRKPWNTLDQDQVGVDALRNRLQEVLANNIRREFSNVKREIQDNLNKARRDHEQLGAKRQTPEEQRRFLLDVSMHFQEIVNMALNSNYSGSNWFDEHQSLLLVTAVVNRDEEFARVLEKYGHRFAFSTDHPDAPAEEEEEEESADESMTNGLFSEYDSSTGSDEKTECKQDRVSKPVKLRSTTDQDDLHELISGQSTMDGKTESNIVDWLMQMYLSSRGFELGTFNQDLLAKAMKAQSAKWEDLTTGYMLDVIHLTHSFIKDLLRLVCADRQVRDGIMAMLLETLLEKYRRAIEHSKFLLAVESRPATLNHYFNENLQKCHQERTRSSLAQYSFSISKLDSRQAVLLDTVIQKQTNLSNTAHTVQVLHDILKSYYKVARKRFVDNICMQAAEFHLVTGPDNPLKLFSPYFVSSLSDEQLEEIAGEDVSLKRKRANLAKEIADLQLGKEIVG